MTISNVRFKKIKAVLVSTVIAGFSITSLLGQATNGSFESGFTGWTTSGNVATAVNGGIYNASNGTTMVYFNGGNTTPNGVVSQAISTTAGVNYTVTFDAGTFGAANTQSLKFVATGSSQLISNTMAFVSPGGTVSTWTPKTFNFTANSSSTTLAFTDLSTVTINTDLLLDNVVVRESPVSLTIASNPTGANIAVSPTDVNTAGAGTANFVRTYNVGTTVTLNAPLQSSAGTFTKWQKNGVDMNTNSSQAVVTIGAATTMTAIYGGPATGSNSQVSLQWNPNPETDVTSYTVSWRKLAETFNSTQTAVINVPTVTATIQNLEPGVTYSFGVQAKNTAGLISPMSAEVTAFIPASSTPQGRIRVVEAESGVLVAPYTTVTLNGITWVESPTFGNSNGSTTMTINVAEAGTYYLWAKTTGVDSGSDSHFVTVDGGTEEIFHVYGVSNPPTNAFTSGWLWRRMMNVAGTSPRAFVLTQGAHTFKFRQRDSAKLDKILVTNEPLLVADDTVSSGEIIILQQPASQAVALNTPVTIQLRAAAIDPISIQWKRNSADLAGNNSESVQINQVGVGNTGAYNATLTTATKSKLTQSAMIGLTTNGLALKTPTLSVGAGNALSLTTNAAPGTLLKIKASSDLVTWQAIQELVYTSGSILINDPLAASNPKRFYSLEYTH